MPAISLTMIMPMTASPRSRSSETSRCGFEVSVLGGIGLSPPIGARDVPDRDPVRQVLPDFPSHHAGAPGAGQLGLALESRQAVVGDVAAPAATLAGDVRLELALAELGRDVLKIPAFAIAAEATSVEGHA